MVSLRLDIDQLKALSEALWDYNDCGPHCAGWASPEVLELRNYVDAKIAGFSAG
jgi:hypothetical protein